MNFNVYFAGFYLHLLSHSDLKNDFLKCIKNTRYTFYFCPNFLDSIRRHIKIVSMSWCRKGLSKQSSTESGPSNKMSRQSSSDTSAAMRRGGLANRTSSEYLNAPRYLKRGSSSEPTLIRVYA